MNEMTKDLLYITEENNLKYYKLKDIEGQIPFVINPVGFNPGLYIHRYVQKLSPDTSDIFPSPLRFHEFRPSDSVWFRGVRIGNVQLFLKNDEFRETLFKCLLSSL